MSRLHERGLPKIRLIAGYILSILATILIAFSGILKLLKDDFLVQAMREINLEGSMVWIGIIELGCVILYWIPATFKFGFYLLCCYVGGIISAELIAASGSELPIPGVPIAAFLFVGTFLRNRSLSGFGF